MKMKLLFCAALLGVAVSVNAQWNTYGTNVYYNNGNVGIGTTTPNQKLDVNGIVRATHTEFYEGSTCLGFIGRGGSYTGGWSAIPSALTLTYAGRDFAIGGWRKSDGIWNGASFFINSDNNNVGIGTITPRVALDVNGNIATNSAMYTDRISYNSGGSTPLNICDQIYIRNDLGNVGIGIATPDRSLTVSGEIGVYGTNATLVFKNTASNNKMFDIAMNGNDLYFNETGIITPLTIKSGGNILIGKITQTNNTYKLDVAGKVRADEITVNTTGADFVFEPTYKLRTLAEVEVFIKAHKHLPEVATAADMQTNGVNMGDMQTKLLQKVEELTLYTIEQSKQLQEQRQTNAALQKQIDELKALINQKLKQ